MIDTTHQYKWLKEWVKDDPEGLGKELETRLFSTLEVSIIMQMYSKDIEIKNNLNFYCKDESYHKVDRCNRQCTDCKDFVKGFK